jgi:4-hydroxy-2-oxoheptanedioate aldolase
VLIDAEHGAIDLADTEAMVRAADARGVATVVRVPSADSAAIGRYLDTGADGVLVPHIASEAQAIAAVRAARYPPRGDRSVGRARSLRYGVADPLVQAAAKADARTFVAVIVEDVPGIDQVSAIAAVAGVDAVLVGAVDLALSMGSDQGPSDPRVRELVDRAIASIIAEGKVAAIGVADRAGAERRVEQGARLLVVNVAELIVGGARDLLPVTA